MVFPSSNGYNSYQDRDNTSIGGMKYPPQVTRNLFYVTLLFDLVALFTALLISPLFAFLIFVFIVMSRLYSFRGIRIKKYPFAAFFTVFIFQGAFVYLMTSVAVSPLTANGAFTVRQLICMLISSLFIGSMYPLTQIYQHEADRRDGVISISYLLGFRGTFIFAGILFAAASALLFYYFGISNQYVALLLFPVLVSPVVVFLYRWFGKVVKNSRHANFENTMKANMLSATCMNAFFLLVIVSNRLI